MTTSEIATREDSSIDILPPQRPPSIVARQMLLQHAEMMDTAYKLAVPMVKTKMVPARFQGKAEDATAAILYGAELGLNPIQSLQRVIPIHGMPSIEARTMVALLKARGYKVWTAAQSSESVTVRGRDLDGDEYQSTWDIDRAVQAGYVPQPSSEESLRRPHVEDDWITVTKTWDGKAKKSVLGNMKYITDPQAMLKAKAQAEVCRDMAPDVLLGISYTREELESEQFYDPQPQREEPAAPAPVTVEEIFGDTPQTAEAAQEDDVSAEPADDSSESPAQPQPASENCSEPETEQVDASKPKPKPEPAEPGVPHQAPKKAAKKAPAKADAKEKKGQMRLALERRLFGLLALADIERDNRADRILIYTDILGRDTPITSTDDLNDVEVAKVCDQLYAWDEKKQLGDMVTDILNRATLAEANAEADQPAEGEK